MRTPALYKKPFLPLSLPPSPFPGKAEKPRSLRGASSRPGPGLLRCQKAPGEFPAARASISDGSPAGAGTFLFALAKPKVIQFALITTISPELSPDSDRRSL